MQKPYRGDYKPDYEKWENIVTKESDTPFLKLCISFAIIIAIFGSAGSFFLGFFGGWSEFSFKDDVLFNLEYHLSYFFTSLFCKFINKFQNKEANKHKYTELAEKEAEDKYREDLDRYEYYWQTKYEEALRNANIDAGVSRISNEELLRQYVRLAEINHQFNERNFSLFNQAKQALESRDSYNIDDVLGQFRQKFLG